jgi:glycosyltransferase involved in cell wall biosynthesis
MDKILISVVVPIYKVEPYLHRCINSIINQTYSHLEIILVDDGSPDKCGEICDEYAKQDKRIEVIHQENGGLSDARNKGMSIATGKYISFVDSDDYLVLEAYEILLKEAEKYQLDVLTGNAINHINSENSFSYWTNIDCELIQPGLNFINCLKKFPVSACLHFAKLSFLRKIDLEFKKKYLHEDVLWTHEMFFFC